MTIEKFNMPTPKNNKKITHIKRAWVNTEFEDESYRKKRSTKRWQKIREQILYANPLCYFCGHAANEVHHIKKEEELFFNKENLCSICTECHDKVDKAYRRGIKPEELFYKKGGCNE